MMRVLAKLELWLVWGRSEMKNNTHFKHQCIYTTNSLATLHGKNMNLLNIHNDLDTNNLNLNLNLNLNINLNWIKIP